MESQDKLRNFAVPITIDEFNINLLPSTVHLSDYLKELTGDPVWYFSFIRQYIRTSAGEILIMLNNKGSSIRGHVQKLGEYYAVVLNNNGIKQKHWIKSTATGEHIRTLLIACLEEEYKNPPIHETRLAPVETLEFCANYLKLTTRQLKLITFSTEDSLPTWHQMTSVLLPSNLPHSVRASVTASLREITLMKSSHKVAIFGLAKTDVKTEPE